MAVFGASLDRGGQVTRRSFGWALIPGDIHAQGRTQGRPHEDTGRRRPSTSPGGGLQQILRSGQASPHSWNCSLLEFCFPSSTGLEIILRSVCSLCKTERASSWRLELVRACSLLTVRETQALSVQRPDQPVCLSGPGVAAPVFAASRVGVLVRPVQDGPRGGQAPAGSPPSLSHLRTSSTCREQEPARCPLHLVPAGGLLGVGYCVSTQAPWLLASKAVRSRHPLV